MTYHQRHMAVFPDPGGSIDFKSQSRDVSACWWIEPKTQLLNILAPKMIAAAAGGQDLTWSSFRQFGLFDPAHLALPTGDFVCRIFMPCGEPFSDETWCSLLWFDARRPPIASDRFVASNGGLKLQLQRIFTPEMIDGLRDLNKRPRIEILVRHTWKASEIEAAKGVLQIPNWMKAVEGLSFEEAQARMNSLRCAGTTPAQYYELRKQQRIQRDKEADKEEAEAFERQRQEWLREHEAEQSVRRYADALSGTYTAERQVSQAAVGQAEAPPVSAQPVEPETPPEKPYSEMVRDAKAKREKMAKATRAQVRAQKANEASGKAFAEKKLRQYEREGKI
jgi:hypothetical protein